MQTSYKKITDFPNILNLSISMYGFKTDQCRIANYRQGG